VLTGDGRLLFSTHIGRIYVLDRESGSVLTSAELIPGLTYDGNWAALVSCPQGSTSGSCPSPNTPAIDPATGRVFVTLNRPGQPDGAVVALQYRGGDAPRLEPLWETPALPGGGAGSPTIAADGTRVYVTDRSEGLVALDVATGSVAWRHSIGYDAGGSPSVSPDGVIVPAGGRHPAHLVAVRDDGDRATTLWERRDVAHRGLAVQPEGGVVYASLVIGAITHLAVVDLATGETLSLTSTGTGAWASMGTAVGPDGSVYLTTPLNGIYALVPVP
jgi:outer membrane protein assembly factor BamB